MVVCLVACLVTCLVACLVACVVACVVACLVVCLVVCFDVFLDGIWGLGTVEPTQITNNHLTCCVCCLFFHVRRWNFIYQDPNNDCPC